MPASAGFASHDPVGGAVIDGPREIAKAAERGFSSTSITRAPRGRGGFGRGEAAATAAHHQHVAMDMDVFVGVGIAALSGAWPSPAARRISGS